MRVFFILGREPVISISEIFAVLSRESGFDFIKKAAATAQASKQALILELPPSTNLPQLMNQLGGTIKIGKIEETAQPDVSPKNLAPTIAEIIKKQPGATSSSKIHFGISSYFGSGGATAVVHGLQKSKTLGMEIKRLLKDDGFKVRWVTSAEPILSSVIVETNKLLKGGSEIVLIIDKEKIEIGCTTAVQPFRELEKRDFTRPGRDVRSGLLPPKLARIITNLTGAPREATLLDPFCGSGTILSEALLLGYTKIIGADLEPAAIKNTKQNLDWLRAKNIIPPSDAAKNIRLIESDIDELNKYLGEESIEAVATETHLGPPLTGRESPTELESIQKRLAPLFRDTLNTLHKILKKNGRAVIAFPLWRNKKQLLHTPVLEEVEKNGFVFVPPLPENLETLPSFATELGLNGKTLIYGRPDQHLWREIAIIRKT